MTKEQKIFEFTYSVEDIINTSHRINLDKVIPTLLNDTLNYMS
jgi:hypothetical protein